MPKVAILSHDQTFGLVYNVSELLERFVGERDAHGSLLADDEGLGSGRSRIEGIGRARLTSRHSDQLLRPAAHDDSAAA